MSAMLHCSITTQVSAFCSFAASQLPHRELNDVSRQSGRSNKHNWRHVQAASLRCLGTALCDEIVDRRISCGKPGIARQRDGCETRDKRVSGTARAVWFHNKIGFTAGDLQRLDCKPRCHFKMRQRPRS